MHVHKTRNEFIYTHTVTGVCVAVCEGDLDFGFDRGGGRGLLILLLLLLFLVRLDWILSVLSLARSAFFCLAVLAGLDRRTGA